MFDKPHAAQNLTIGFYAIAAWMIIGLLLNIASLLRGERHKGLAIIGAGVYAAPAFMAVMFLIILIP